MNEPADTKSSRVRLATDDEEAPEQASNVWSLSRIDRITVVVCALAIAVLLVALYLDRKGLHDTAGSAPTVGNASFTVSDVRRRPETGLVWESLQTGDPVFGRDALFVAPKSSASVRFKDGTVLVLDAGTMVALDVSPEEKTRASIRVARGSISAESGADGLVVHTERGAVQLAENTQARLAIDAKKAVRVEVAAGRATLGDGVQTATVARHEAAGFSAEGALVPAQKLPVRLREPPANARIYYRDRPPAVQLSWQASEDGDRILQISQDQDFLDPLVSSSTQKAQSTFVPPGTGEFWWRIVAPTGEALSAVHKFIVVAATPPVPLIPPPDEIVMVPPGQGLRLAWSHVGGAAQYLVELSRDASFTHTEIAERVSADHVRITTQLPEGQYFWRVRTVDHEQLQSAASGVSRFRLVHRALIEAPEILDVAGHRENGRRVP